MSEFVPVAREDEVPVGEVKVVHAQDKSLALGHCEELVGIALDRGNPDRALEFFDAALKVLPPERADKARSGRDRAVRASSQR